jgi:hypothetical protein
MGVLKGVADFYSIDISDEWLFGGSGHAFLINIKNFAQVVHTAGIQKRSINL